MQIKHSMRVLIIGLFLAAWAAMVPAPAAHGGSLAPWVEGQLVVKINPQEILLIDLNAFYGTHTLASLPGHDIHLLQVPLGIDTLHLLQELQSDPAVEYAELNYTQQAPEAHTDTIYGWGGGDSAPLSGQSWSSMLYLDKAHRYSTGRGAVVAILDTGVQPDHPLLSGALTEARYDFVEWDSEPWDEADGIDEDGNGMVDQALGHGTHVAGIVRQVAPDAQIMPLRVLNADGRGDNFRLAEAILFAAANGADVINLSLGSPHPSLMVEEIVNEVAAANVVVVAAAGNSNVRAPQYPAANTCAVAVASVNSNKRKSSFSNFGSWVDLAAPGESIYSALPSMAYGWWSGTSMATPLVAGQAALLLGANNALTLEQVGTLLGSSAQAVRDQRVGAGMPHYQRSLRMLSGLLAPDPAKNVLSGCQQ